MPNVANLINNLVRYKLCNKYCNLCMKEKLATIIQMNYLSKGQKYLMFVGIRKSLVAG